MSFLDAVLPVTLRDVPRARILLRSLSGRLHALGTLFVIAPDSQCDEVRQALGALDAGVSFEVVAESIVVPELAWFPQLKGWYRQQLIKLAMAERVHSNFYLTFDADVICTVPAAFDDLMHIDDAGVARAPCTILNENSHPDWYENTVAVLGIPPRRQGILHNVTPTILAVEGVVRLQEHLESRVAWGLWANGWRGVRQRAVYARWRWQSPSGWALWRVLLAASAPWTEYALYYTLLESTGRFTDYHVETDTCLYDVDRSVWRADRRHFKAWDPSPLFSASGPPFFAIVQSNTGIAPDKIEAKLADFF